MPVNGNDMLLGRIALASGMITRQQLEECIAVANSGDSTPLTELLVQRQYLTEEQLQIVVGIHGGPPQAAGASERSEPFGPAAAEDGTAEKGSNEPTDIVSPAPQGAAQAAAETAPSESVLPPMKPDAPPMTLFGRMIVDKGWATPEQVEECLKYQKELGSQGQVKQIGEIMLERGILTLDQIQELLSAQNKIILACGGCGTRYNAANVQPGKVVKCVKCGEMLKVPDRIESARTEATVFGDGISRTSDALIGKEIGGCRVLERLGRGGMATVYKAKHIGLNKMMAIKILPPTASQSRDTLERFLREARAAAKLEHPNVVQVYNVGRELGYTFILMQYIEGLTLAEKIDELGYLPEQECLHIIKDVTRAFVFAHKNGIVHRDVKPDNIMMTSKGEVKVMDFGLAQDVQLKQEGKIQLIVGTPSYMPPEQWQGRAADVRSDIYALGVTFYFILTGKRPFQSKVVPELMKMHLYMPPPSPKRDNKDVSEYICAVVLKMMQKNPKDRYQTAQELLSDMDRIETGMPPAAFKASGKTLECPFCFSLNAPESRKCEVCGEYLMVEKKIDILLLDDEALCPKCKTIIKKETPTCFSCGTTVCNRCWAKAARQGGMCETCGRTHGQPPPHDGHGHHYHRR